MCDSTSPAASRLKRRGSDGLGRHRREHRRVQRRRVQRLDEVGVSGGAAPQAVAAPSTAIITSPRTLRRGTGRDGTSHPLSGWWMVRSQPRRRSELVAWATAQSRARSATSSQPGTPGKCGRSANSTYSVMASDCAVLLDDRPGHADAERRGPVRTRRTASVLARCARKSTRDAVRGLRSASAPSNRIGPAPGMAYRS